MQSATTILASLSVGGDLHMREGVWTHGEDTEFQAWIAGESRTIRVTREAIEGYLPLSSDSAAALNAEHRAEFVRNHLALVIAAANRKIDPIDRAADVITIRSGEL
jgi:hypothetical protein